MAEADGTTTEGTETGTESTETVDVEKLKADLEKWKAHSRKNEAAAKANADAAKAWSEYRETQKTEAQRLAEAQAAAEKAAKDAQEELARYKVAANTGVPAELLTGSSEEELEASAKALLEFAGKQKPTPDLGQGNRGSAASADPNAWLRQMARRG